MALVPGSWHKLLEPGIKASSGKCYYDYMTDKLHIEKNGDKMSITKEFLEDVDDSIVCQVVRDFLDKASGIPPLRLVDVGEGMLVPKQFMDEFNTICQKPIENPFKPVLDDLSFIAYESQKEAIAYWTKLVDESIMKKHMAIFDKPKSLFILDPDDHPLIIPPDEPPPKLTVVKTMLVLPSDPEWYGVISLPE
jgi:hypothetical protein